MPQSSNILQYDTVFERMPTLPSATLYSTILCDDARTIDFIRHMGRTCKDGWWWRLLLHQSLLATPQNDTLHPSTHLVLRLVLDPHYIEQGARFFNYDSYRFSWKVSAKEDLVAFYSVYYSVLGGAYSSLGKTNAKYAVKAGSLAQRQIQMAQWLQDPILECKCWLYYAEDMIMQGRLDQAQQILVKQQLIANKHHNTTLQSMTSFVRKKWVSKYKSMRTN
ncbi:hypothetical protein DM01DRAFT_1340139 [Hesseltinella vesiculosa]|uniref:Uncharacterized protein n=1 Tax=Hesseltinella vesiculosa TaxID=101127 RepID=A0A1X2G573_9FUNG|nr:hypothetical protein DM01DRAFT_1340139 [Hesseltinella vesiculosa]